MNAIKDLILKFDEMCGGEETEMGTDANKELDALQSVISAIKSLEFDDVVGQCYFCRGHASEGHEDECEFIACLQPLDYLDT